MIFFETCVRPIFYDFGDIFSTKRIIVKIYIYIYSSGACTRIVLMFTVNHVKRDLFIGSLEPPGAQFLSNDDR